MVRITSEPCDAQIFINGQRRGSTPCQTGKSFTLQLKAGTYNIEAVLSSGDMEKHGVKEVFVSDDTLQDIQVELKTTRPTAARRAQLRQKFGNAAPSIEMVKIPSGSFQMGGTESENERPVHTRNIQAFELGKTEVTFDQWDACFVAGGCKHYPEDKGWGRGSRPVIDVSWSDAQEFIAWINRVGGGRYRLPSEAEWEYAARLGSTVDCFDSDKANFDGSDSRGRWNCSSNGVNREMTMPVASFPANSIGVHDMHGNVWEWTQDCYVDSYVSIPSGANGDAVRKGKCDSRVSRGGSWGDYPRFLRSAVRSFNTPVNRSSYSGFRLARTLAP